MPKAFREIPAPTVEMTNAFHAAEQFYFAKKYEDAIFSYQSYIRNFAYNTLTAKAYYRLGEISLGQGELDEAIGYYRRSVSKGVQAAWIADAFYKQAVALHKQGKYGDIFKVLDRVPAERLDQKLAIRVGSLRVSAAKKMGGRDVEELKGYLELFNAYATGSGEPAPELGWLISRDQAWEELRAWLQKEEQDPAPVASLVPRFEGKPAGAYLLWKVGNLYYAKGDYKKAGQFLNRFLSGYPKSEFVPEARKLYAEVEKRGGGAKEEGRPASGDAISIGVLLPLSGRYAVYGESVLHGLECAAGVFEPCSSDFSVNLVIRDTEGSPKVAAQKMRELVADPKIIGIIGPLPQLEIDAVVPIAEQNQIPMVALSQREDVPRLGEMVFRNFLTVADQVSTVVQHACRTKKLKKLAILYPKGAAGEAFLQSFEKEVEDCGGKVVGRQSYGGKMESYVDLINSLKGAQALFIPDVYRRVIEILPSLEFANIPDVVLLGGAGWDHPDLLKGGSRLEGSVFVDGFYAGSSQYGTRDFTQMVHSTYGVDPTLLEAYAYDTLKLMGTTIDRQQIKTRLQLHDALARVKNFSGVTGNISFDNDGDARRKLLLLQVSEGAIKEL